MGAVEVVWTGDQMGQVRIRADRPWPQRRASSSRTMAFVLAAFGISAAAAAWVADPGDTAIAEAELHWFEAHGVGKRRMKIKRLL